MTSSNEMTSLLEDDRIQWQAIADYLLSNGCATGNAAKIEQLAIASRYALAQLQRNPAWIGDLLELQHFELASTIIEFPEGEKIDLDQVKRTLRQYRHRKLVEIIYLDTVQEQSLQATLLQQSDLADQLILCALDVCQRQLAAKHGQPLEASGAPMTLNVITMGKLGGRELNFSSDIDLICSYDSDG